MYFNREQQREILAELAKDHLKELHRSISFGGGQDHESVAYTRGKLGCACFLFAVDGFRVEKRWKITFYRLKWDKNRTNYEEVVWFEVVNEFITEEEADLLIEMQRREQADAVKLMRQAGF